MRRPEPLPPRGSDEIASDGQALANGDSADPETRRWCREGGTDLAVGVSGISQVSTSPSAPMVRVSSHSRVHVLRPTEPYPRLLAEFSTEPTGSETQSGRWTRLRITQLGPDQYLCEKSRGPEPLEERSATVNSISSAKAFFGGGWVVKELFAKLDPKRFPRWP